MRATDKRKQTLCQSGTDFNGCKFGTVDPKGVAGFLAFRSLLLGFLNSGMVPSTLVGQSHLNHST